MLARVLRSEEGYLYPEELADEGMGGKTRSIIPAGLRGRGYGRKNQVDYTRWSSWTRVCETKSSRLYPLVFASEGMGDKIKPIYPLAFAGEGM